MTINEPNKIYVLDSGPIIEGFIPAEFGARCYTVPEVLREEIRDVATRERLERLIPPIVQQKATDRSIEYVCEFARKTGDLSVLSPVDIRILALTLDLSIEHDAYVLSEIQGGPNLNENLDEVRPENLKIENLTIDEDTHDDSLSLDDTRVVSPSGLAPENDLNKIKAVNQNEIWKKSEDSAVKGNGSIRRPQRVGQLLGWGDNWITPETLQSNRCSSIDLGDDEFEGNRVTCVTGDFAVQNVLLQMRLPLRSVDGKRITETKSWLLRCHGCYWTTRRMERRFCDRCGNATLTRAAYKICGKSGETQIFLSKSYSYKLRGTIAPLPMPRGGRSAGLILREDQKEYQRALYHQKREERKAISQGDLDSIDDRLAVVFGSTSIKSESVSCPRRKAMIDGPVIGFGRKNPNVVRRRS